MWAAIQLICWPAASQLGKKFETSFPDTRQSDGSYKPPTVDFKLKCWNDNPTGIHLN